MVDQLALLVMQKHFFFSSKRLNLEHLCLVFNQRKAGRIDLQGTTDINFNGNNKNFSICFVLIRYEIELLLVQNVHTNSECEGDCRRQCCIDGRFDVQDGTSSSLHWCRHWPCWSGITTTIIITCNSNPINDFFIWLGYVASVERAAR